ncbi:flavin reductase family protein [Streptomyces sp. P38-E01]|uniref:Flavin reductase family protein n=1 Tax=Streptomyces tardus TaxID=2780544 RepID=A0A949JIE4_9ACTN|nr:flavin reductase family protein [Streptomyces tardus]
MLDQPVQIVTAAAGGERAGCLVGFAGQCSLRPVRFAVWLSRANRTWRVADRADHLGVRLLDPERLDLARLFGGETDKFARTPWRSGPGGAPVLEGAAAWCVGAV